MQEKEMGAGISKNVIGMDYILAQNRTEDEHASYKVAPCGLVQAS